MEWGPALTTKDQLLWYPCHNGLHPQARSPFKCLLPYVDFSPGILTYREKGNLGMLLGVIWVCCLVPQTDSQQRGVTQTSKYFHSAKQRHLAEETFRKINPTGGLTQKVRSFSALFAGILWGQGLTFQRKTRYSYCLQKKQAAQRNPGTHGAHWPPRNQLPISLSLQLRGGSIKETFVQLRLWIF